MIITNLLIKTFIKDSENVQSPQVREAYGRLGGIVGILSNVLLCVSKILIGIFFQSVAIMADGINNLSDAGSSIITLIGFKLSSKPADEDHPFGHERIEYVTGLIVSFLILLLGIELIRSSVEKILNPEPLQFNWIMIGILILSILVKLWLSHFTYILGHKINSSTMCATAADSRNDVIATSAILVSIGISYFTDFQLDGYMGIAVGIFILYSGINIIKETTNPLLGQSPSPDLIKSITDKLISYEGVLGYHDLVVHSYGPNRWFASVHVEVSAYDDLIAAHDHIDIIEKDFNSEMGINMVIHLDPIITSDPETNALREKVVELVTSIDSRLSIHDFRRVVGPTHSNLIFDVTVPVGFTLTPYELANEITRRIKEIDESYYTVITIDTNYISTSVSSYKE